MLLSSLVNKQSTNNFKNAKFADFLNGSVPIFSQFGNDIFASDVVQMCIDVIATECSKLRPRHIRGDSKKQSEINSSINRLFKFAPNELMTTRDFLEKTIWLLYLNSNCFIYPIYEITKDSNNNNIRKYTGLYPLNPVQVDFIQDASDKLFVKFFFSNGQSFTLAYSDVIHLRKKFGVNDIMGGGLDGRPDNAALLKVLNINDTLLQGVEKAIGTSLSVRGVMKFNTMMDGPLMMEEKKKFEEALNSGKTGILPLDLKGEYIPVNSDPKLIDKATLEFIDNKILRYFGVSLPILNGDFNDEQYQAFYEKTLEPLIISLGQAFSKTIFTENELNFGNEIIFYQRDMMYLSTKTKLELIKTAGEQGLLQDDQKLALLGYPPLPDGTGDRRTMSLNYINVELADAYQMQKSNLKEKTPN
jgi:HK97 family phage portal protein